MLTSHLQGAVDRLGKPHLKKERSLERRKHAKNPTSRALAIFDTPELERELRGLLARGIEQLYDCTCTIRRRVRLRAEG